MRWFKKKLDILFFCSTYVDEIWLRSTIVCLQKYHLKIALIIAGDFPETIKKNYAHQNISLLTVNTVDDLAHYKTKLVVSASTSLRKEWFAKNIRHFIHMPHSLVSLHSVYPEDAFDAFDCLFACGQHHVQEFKQIAAMRNKNRVHIFEIGYGKLDLLLASPANLFKSDSQHVLIAPSWGDANIIETIGVALIEKLLEQNYTVTLRPHPMFYFSKKDLMKPYAAIEHFRFNIENPSESFESLYKSETLVTDYSGVFLEYFSLKKRRIIFVDSPVKIFNSEFLKYTLPAIEITMRENFGEIVANNVEKAYTAITSMEPLVHAKTEQFIYNKGKSGEIAAAKIQELLS